MDHAPRMRKEIYRMDRAEAVALLGRAPAVHVVGTTAEGAPLFRTVNAVVLGGHVAFHGAPVGEKTGAVGRPVVVTAEETIASIPSYFVDPERACPATTYYRSVHVHGVLEAVDDAAEKAHVMAALMDKYQPEGGHVPIDAEHPLYRKALAGLLVARVSLERLDGKSKLGQNRTPPELVRVLEQLWQRGAPGDAVAIESVLRANPATPVPPFLRGPHDLRLVCALGAEDAEAAADLIEGQYWNEGVSRRDLIRGCLASQAWVGVREGTQLVAMARALSDGVRSAWIGDVAVTPRWRGRGLATALMKLVLDHPALRHAQRVWLATRDAQKLYEKLGFVDVQEASAYPRTDMVLKRSASQESPPSRSPCFRAST